MRQPSRSARAFLNKKSYQINLQSVGLLCSSSGSEAAVRSFTFSHSTRGSLLINLCKRPARLLLSFSPVHFFSLADTHTRRRQNTENKPKPNPSRAINLTFLLLQRWITRKKLMRLPQCARKIPCASSLRLGKNQFAWRKKSQTACLLISTPHVKSRLCCGASERAIWCWITAVKGRFICRQCN